MSSEPSRRGAAPPFYLARRAMPQSLPTARAVLLPWLLISLEHHHLSPRCGAMACCRSLFPFLFRPMASGLMPPILPNTGGASEPWRVRAATVLHRVRLQAATIGTVND